MRQRCGWLVKNSPRRRDTLHARLHAKTTYTPNLSPHLSHEELLARFHKYITSTAHCNVQVELAGKIQQHH
jgi:hypothetical protein